MEKNLRCVLRFIAELNFSKPVCIVAIPLYHKNGYSEELKYRVSKINVTRMRGYYSAKMIKSHIT